MRENTHAQVIADILYDYEFRQTLDEAWKLSSENNYMTAFPVYHSQNPSEEDIILGDVITGTTDDIRIDTLGLVKRGLEEFDMPLYLLVRLEPIDQPLVPTLDDLNILSDVRTLHECFDISLRPLGGLAHFSPYGNERSLSLLLYQENTSKPAFQDLQTRRSIEEIVPAIFHHPREVPRKYTISPSLTVDRIAVYNDSSRARMMEELSVYRTGILPYHRDLRVGTIPYTWIGRDSLDKFNQTVGVN